MVLNYMDYQIKQFENNMTAAVYRNGREILSLKLDARLSPEKLVERAGRAMRMAGIAAAGDAGDELVPRRFGCCH